MRREYGQRGATRPPASPGRYALIATAILTVAAIAVAGCGRADGTTGPPEPGTPPPSTVPPPPSPPTAEPPTSPPTDSPAPTTPSPTMLRLGDRGPDVRELQERLAELGFWLGGDPDGVFGALTQHAVTAFQKVSGIDRDGIAGPQTRQELRSASRPTAHSDEDGRVIEVDLERQVLLVVVDGRVEHVLDASTGEVPGTTPTGRYEVFRQVDGDDPGPLGTLYRPKYFNGGVAVHGYSNVPPYPASHGCVRVVNQAMDWLWSSGNIPIGQSVWVY
jgi:cell wall hydrolase